MKTAVIFSLLTLPFFSHMDAFAATTLAKEKIIFGSAESENVRVRVVRELTAPATSYRDDISLIFQGKHCQLQSLSGGDNETYVSEKLFSAYKKSTIEDDGTVTGYYLNGTFANSDWQPLFIDCKGKLTLQEVEADLSDSVLGASIRFESAN